MKTKGLLLSLVGAGLVGSCLLATGSVPAHAQTVMGVWPLVDCVSYDAPNQFLTVYFGYVSGNANSVTVEISTLNFISPNPLNRGQPTSFLPGVNHDAWSTVVNLATDTGVTLEPSRSSGSGESEQPVV
jgi:hypothetical protein